jgi:predicted GNAT family N-acyltransferase
MQSPGEMNYDGDNEKETVHLGAFEKEKLIGIVSLYRQSMPGSDDGCEWRFRNMAVIEELRGKGIGKMLMEKCIKEAIRKGASVLWCNARVSAEKFYEKMGMKKISDVFEVEQIGPHVQMKMDLI